MIHLVTITAGIAVNAAMLTATVQIHPVFTGQYSFCGYKVQVPHLDVSALNGNFNDIVQPIFKYTVGIFDIFQFESVGNQRCSVYLTFFD